MFERRKRAYPSLFGAQLKINAELLSRLLADPRALLHEVVPRTVKDFEDDKWKSLSYPKLLFLTAKAAELGLPLFTVESSELWATFRKHDEKNRVVIGQDLKGNTVEVDNACAQPFVAAFESKLFTGKIDPAQASRFMESENLICIGGPKVNVATRVALDRFNEASDLPVRFLWPNYNPKSAAEEKSSDENRHLEIGTEKFTENEEKRRRYGLVAVCRKSSDRGKELTTVVIAGCSRHATESMAQAVQHPDFNRMYKPHWAKAMDGRPVFFIFEESADAITWHVRGNPEKVRRPPGRRPGKRKPKT